MRILVADDDPSSRLITQTAVRLLGHDCFTVTDGKQAWDAVQAARPDVVISDWMMPGLSGLELCQRIREHTAGEYTYLILLTSQGSIDQALEGMRAGADDYLIKPLNPDDLQIRLIAAARVTDLHRPLAARPESTRSRTSRGNSPRQRERGTSSIGTAAKNFWACSA